jgi:hypothetical protein
MGSLKIFCGFFIIELNFSLLNLAPSGGRVMAGIESQIFLHKPNNFGGEHINNLDCVWVDIIYQLCAYCLHTHLMVASGVLFFVKLVINYSLSFLNVLHNNEHDLLFKLVNQFDS